MICCCSLAGTSACNNCLRKKEYEYPQYVIDYAKTDPWYLQKDSVRIAALEHAIERLNEKIDKLLEQKSPSLNTGTGKLTNKSNRINVYGYGKCVDYNDLKTSIKCDECGGNLDIDDSVVLTSSPAKYKAICKNCGKVGYVYYKDYKTSKIVDEVLKNIGL